MNEICEISGDKLEALYKYALEYDRLYLKKQPMVIYHYFTRSICLRCDLEVTYTDSNTPLFCHQCENVITGENRK